MNADARLLTGNLSFLEFLQAPEGRKSVLNLGWERKSRRGCGNVEIALFAISKGGGRRWETRCRAWMTRNARRAFSTGVHRPAFP